MHFTSQCEATSWKRQKKTSSTGHILKDIRFRTHLADISLGDRVHEQDITAHDKAKALLLLLH